MNKIISSKNKLRKKNRAEIELQVKRMSKAAAHDLLNSPLSDAEAIKQWQDRIDAVCEGLVFIGHEKAAAVEEA
jgi:hypothetical protein